MLCQSLDKKHWKLAPRFCFFFEVGWGEETKGVLACSCIREVLTCLFLLKEQGNFLVEGRLLYKTSPEPICYRTTFLIIYVNLIIDNVVRYTVPPEVYKLIAYLQLIFFIPAITTVIKS